MKNHLKWHQEQKKIKELEEKEKLVEKQTASNSSPSIPSPGISSPSILESPIDLEGDNAPSLASPPGRKAEKRKAKMSNNNISDLPIMNLLEELKEGRNKSNEERKQCNAGKIELIQQKIEMERKKAQGDRELAMEQAQVNRDRSRVERIREEERIMLRK